MHQCSYPSAKHMLYRYVSPSLVGHFFVLMQVKLGIFCQFTVVQFDLCSISNIFSCPYANITLRMELLTLISSIKI